MKLNQVVAICLITLSTFGVAQAAPTTIPTVSIGNPGNLPDTRYVNVGVTPPTGIGAVAHSFQIGKTEVTNAQYTVFLNAVAATDMYGLYNTEMGSEFLGGQTWGGIVRSGTPGSFVYSVKPAALNGAYTYDDKPVVYVNWGDAARFANWLHNGQPTGEQGASTTEDGAYTLNGAVTDGELAAVTRNSVARWWLPSSDEWYKAAYHKNDGVTGNYWDFPTGSNSMPNNHLPTSDNGDSANFFNEGYTTGNISLPMTDAGAYQQSFSPYGTFDQGGNVWELNETRFIDFVSSVRARGGSWGGVSDDLFAAQSLPVSLAFGEAPGIGFRVASIPEPNGICLASLGVAATLIQRRSRSCLPSRQHYGL
jgi:sulfatase modifying factor 1